MSKQGKKENRTYDMIVDDIKKMEANQKDTFKKYKSRFWELLDLPRLDQQQVNDIFLLLQEKLQNRIFVIPFNNLQKFLKSKFSLLAKKYDEYSETILREIDIQPEMITGYIHEISKGSNHKLNEELKRLYSTSKEESLKLLGISAFYYSLVRECQNRNSLNYLESVIIIDRTFSEIFSGNNDKSRQSLALSCVAKVLGEEGIKQDKFYQMTFLYRQMSVDYEKKVSECDALSQMNTELVEEKKELNKKIDDQKNQIVLKNSEISALQNQMKMIDEKRKTAEDRLEFEKGQLDEKYSSLKGTMSSDLTRRIGQEIVGIMETVNELPEEEARRIRRRIERIKKILSELEEE